MGFIILNTVLLSSPPRFGTNKKDGKLQEWETARCLVLVFLIFRSFLKGLLILNTVVVSSPRRFGANKKGGRNPPFLPQIYHELNLLMLWQILKYYNEGLATKTFRPNALLSVEECF
ncbi:hypothetical protein CJ305_00095 [Leeuwenhoekiella nanhaiensis]|uniref:Uncharacterized protein n=1 Tax=Leeuwenhoekiella nanhaiensis TaxID=1655491 RepID=A0A2G1VW56_9FLAO|nr:hypothetical protein CJ305_00095 [Leeuwenhoekiella nanhaiensis]